MTNTLFLSRARLRSHRGEALSAIAKLLVPSDPDAQVGHAHSVVWLLFQDVPDATRDFLWRDEGGGRYLILSPRPPADPQGLFELDTKPFAPDLTAGDRLSFSLRANPTLATKRALDPEERTARQRGQRVDVVMDALHKLPKEERVLARDRIATEAGTRWLDTQGAKAGFRVLQEPALAVDSYTQVAVERRPGGQGRKRKHEGKRKARPAGFSVLDFKGLIEITEPAVFLQRLSKGFGSAKAFGNGLMLIRRA